MFSQLRCSPRAALEGMVRRMQKLGRARLIRVSLHGSKADELFRGASFGPISMEGCILEFPIGHAMHSTPNT